MKAAIAAVEEEETVEMKVARAARERQAKEDAEAAAEAANDQECVREWRQGAADLVPESVFQLAMAYELGLFGVKRNRSKAIKLYASLVNAPGDEDDDETSTIAEEKSSSNDHVDDANNNESSDSSSGSNNVNDENEQKESASDPLTMPSSAARTLAANEIARLEAEERNDFVSGGAPATINHKASPKDDGAAEEAKKKKVIKSKPAPVMATFGYQIHSPILEASYDRNRQQTSTYM